MSSKGASVMFSSQAEHEVLSIAYLTPRGLVSLLKIWQRHTAKDLNRLIRTGMPSGEGMAIYEVALARFRLPSASFLAKRLSDEFLTLDNGYGSSENRHGHSGKEIES